MGCRCRRCGVLEQESHLGALVLVLDLNAALGVEHEELCGSAVQVLHSEQNTTTITLLYEYIIVHAATA